MEQFNFEWETSEGNGNAIEEARETRSGANQQQETQSAGPSSTSSRGKYRHNRYQIQELETSFKENPSPDERERFEIARKLNLEPHQVKFWFQNRRTHVKTQTDRHDNKRLTQENEELRITNAALKDALRDTVCQKCGGPTLDEVCHITNHERNLMIENARLKEELNRIATLIPQVPHGMTSSSLLPPSTSDQGVASGSINVADQGRIYLDLASSAMDELMKLGLVDAPLWIRNMETGVETLNLNEYISSFPPILGTKPLGFVSEGSRATGVVSLRSVDLVEALLDANRWREMFSNVIGSSATTEVVLDGGINNVLQLMQAEIQLISPSVPARVMKFFRFSRQQAEGVWAVVDLSVDVDDNGGMCRRLPSGCILHDLSNGFSKVTWIEHTEYDELPVHHQYRRLLSSGLGFGAQKWICALLRHCEWLRALSSPSSNYQLNQTTRTSIKGLARRMTSIFCAGVCLTGGQRWNLVADSPRIMTRRSMNDPCEPPGIILSASISVWIPAVTHRRLFDLLLEKDLRCLWDVICHANATGIVAYFPMSQDDENPNSISLLSSDNPILVLQETTSDVTGSLIVYAPVDLATISVLMTNSDSTSCVALLPSGLYIVPGLGEGGEGGSMVTVGFQMLLPVLDTPNLITMDTINTVNNLMSRTIIGIEEIARSTR